MKRFTEGRNIFTTFHNTATSPVHERALCPCTSHLCCGYTCVLRRVPFERIVEESGTRTVPSMLLLVLQPSRAPLSCAITPATDSALRISQDPFRAEPSVQGSLLRHLVVICSSREALCLLEQLHLQEPLVHGKPPPMTAPYCTTCTASSRGEKQHTPC